MQYCTEKPGPPSWVALKKQHTRSVGLLDSGSQEIVSQEGVIYNKNKVLWSGI